MTRRPKNSININDFKVKDYRIQKYKDEVGFQYVARDKNDGHIICDHMNKGGFLTSWIRKKYGVDVPSLYERRLYYQMNGDYWWEQWFDILKVPIEAPSIVCPYCDWKCNDASNHSGAYTVHLRDVHNVDFREHLKRFPQDTKFLSKQLDEIKRSELKENEDNYVICPICGEKLFKMTPSHLKHKHNMTMDEFKLKYPNANIMSKMMHEQASELVKLGNMVPRKRIFVSSYEKIIQDMLCENNIEFEPNRQILIGKEIDILIPSKKFGIEFDGLLYHSEGFGKKDKNYHLNKTNKCNAKGYSLIHVFEDELHGKKDITLRRIKHKLGLNNDLPKVDGRKCLVRKIDIELAKDFANQNDLAIWNGGDYSIGAFCNDELVGVLVAKDGDKIITHLSTHNKFLCRGVASKLVKTYVREMHHKEVFVYADKRWTCDGDSNLFTKIGFERLEDIEPRAWFYYPKKFRYLRFPNKLQEDEYDVIYDCGYFSYKFSKGKKPKGYWRIKDNVLSEALKYKTRKEFIKGCKSAYNAALVNGWIDEASRHFEANRENYDMNSKIHVVYVYEFQELNYCYVGRTINLHERDIIHRRGHKSHGVVHYDSLKRFCIAHDIDMPQPIVKYNDLDAVESLEKEEELLNEYVLNGWNVINQGKVGVGSGSLGGFKKWNKDACKAFCKKYKTVLEVRNANYTCYKECVKNGWFDEFGIVSSQETPSGFWNNYDNCLVEAKKYSSITDLQFNRYGCYLGIIRNGWRKIFDDIYTKDLVRKWNYDACKEEAKKYKSKTEMKKGNQSAYVASVKRGWIDEFFTNQKLPNGYWNDFAHIQEEALKWKNAREFAINGKGAYNAAKRNGWLDKLKYCNEKL